MSPSQTHYFGAGFRQRTVVSPRCPRDRESACYYFKSGWGTRTALTNAFGYFSFSGISGVRSTNTPRQENSIFAASQSVTLNEDLTVIEFTGSSQTASGINVSTESVATRLIQRIKSNSESLTLSFPPLSFILSTSSRSDAFMIIFGSLYPFL